VKLALELGLAIAAGLIAYRATSCLRGDDRAGPGATASPQVARSQVSSNSSGSVALSAPPMPRSGAVVSSQSSAGSAMSPQQIHEENILRNSVIVAASESMSKRNVALEECFGDTPIVDTLKLRFSVDVSSTPDRGVTRAWRFDQIVEGQELPPTFGACASETLGRDQRFLPPAGSRLPTFDGELSIVYTLTRQPMNAKEAGETSGAN
jgi:hypothetical protein